MSMDTSVNGIQNSIHAVNKYAAQIAGNPLKDDLARNMVGLMVGEKNVQVGVKAVQAQDEMLGSLIDMKA